MITNNYVKCYPLLKYIYIYSMWVIEVLVIKKYPVRQPYEVVNN